MPSLEILHPGLLTTVQDLGRKGLNFYAIPGSGAMDPRAAQLALLLLAQEPDGAVIECTAMAPTLLFHDPVRIVLTGADFHWQVNGKPVPLNTVLNLQTGDQLSGKQGREGFRGYIALEGILQLDAVYGSVSTYLNAGWGGKEGRPLRKGDHLEWLPPAQEDGEIVRIPLQKGPEFHWLSPASQTALFQNEYRIGTDSNRMGVRLEGPALTSEKYQLEHSRPVLPGFVQLPPGGVPIVVLQDGQTTGGYPRIAYIRERDLGRFNQLGLKEGFVFGIAGD